jgi:hypothetical protein
MFEPNILKSVRLALAGIEAVPLAMPLPAAGDNELPPIVVAAIQAAPTKKPA